MDRQKVAKEAIAHYNKIHANPSSEAKNFYIGGWLDGVQQLYSLVKRMREARHKYSALSREFCSKGMKPRQSQEWQDARKLTKLLESEVDEYLKKMEE